MREFSNVFPLPILESVNTRIAAGTLCVRSQSCLDIVRCSLFHPGITNSAIISRTVEGQLICYETYSTLKMEAIFFSETLIYFQRTTRRYVPEDSTLHNHLCENRTSFH
jgi:hypothetical protein